MKIVSLLKKKTNIFFKKQSQQKDEKKSTFLDTVQLNHHKLSLEELEQEFNTSVTNGLETQFSEQLLSKDGPNRIKQKSENKLLKILSYFFSGFGSLFLFAAVVCILAWRPIGAINGEEPDLSNLALGILLVLVIVVQAGFNAFQDWSSQKVMKSIKNMMPSNAYVIRSGREVAIPCEDIVVGDLVRLQYGQKVPADCRIIETRDLKFDKSMLTGESEAIEGTVECTDEKYVESKNIAYMTTLVTNGQGKGIVVATGSSTMMGRIAGLTSQSKKKKTSLQKEIHRFMNFICIGAVINAIIVVVTWSAWLRVKHPNYISVPNLLVSTISVVIGFIPDG
jgi:sodium/potassium-transporting ATPase subunit alpha